MNMLLMTFVPGQDPAIAAEKERVHVLRRLIVSIVFTVPLFYLSLGHLAGAPLPPFLAGDANAISYAMTQLLLMVPVVFVNWEIFTSGFRSLIHRHPNMDALVALGAAAAIVYGIVAIYRIGIGLGGSNDAVVSAALGDIYFDSAAMILTLITVGKYFEARARGRTTSALSQLYKLTPKTATKLVDGKEVTVKTEDIRVGDLLLVKAGESVPVDGVVVKGEGSVDESAITGEPLPVDKKVGSPVTGATINENGVFTMKAQRVGANTTIAGIIKLVDQAQLAQAPVQKLADRISAIVIPIIIGVAVVTFVIWLLLGAGVSFALTRAISVLIITCPCALGLATPTAIMVATGRGAHEGILIKTGDALQISGNIDVVAFDKTGTITEGKPQVTDSEVASGVSEQEYLSAALSLEKLSDHPLAKAVVSYVQGKDADTPVIELDKLTQVAGGGLKAQSENHTYLAGNKRLMDENNVPVDNLKSAANRFANTAETVLYIASDTTPLGVMALADVAKPTSATAMKELHDMGIKTVMITGDTQQTADAVARSVGIDQVIAGVLPQGKEKEIAKLQQGGSVKVAMVGDGINDAPALAKADVGIAVGAGTDVAISSADIIIMSNDLVDVAASIDLSRATMKNVKQNLIWALIYNVIAIPIAAGVLTAIHFNIGPMIAAAAMAASSVGVVLNSLKLRRWKKFGETTIPEVKIPEKNLKESEAAVKAAAKSSSGMGGMMMPGMDMGSMGGMDMGSMGGMDMGSMGDMDMSSKDMNGMGGMDMGSMGGTNIGDMNMDSSDKSAINGMSPMNKGNMKSTDLGAMQEMDMSGMNSADTGNMDMSSMDMKNKGMDSKSKESMDDMGSMEMDGTNKGSMVGMDVGSMNMSSMSSSSVSSSKMDTPDTSPSFAESDKMDMSGMSMDSMEIKPEKEVVTPSIHAQTEKTTDQGDAAADENGTIKKTA